MTVRISAPIICAMNEITLTVYLLTHSQNEAAKLLGVTQAAVSQMVAAERDIRIKLDATGEPVSGYEIKAFDSRAA